MSDAFASAVVLATALANPTAIYCYYIGLAPEMPPPAGVPTDPVGAIRARHISQGLQIHARSGCPGWLGERLDVAWAIDVPHPRAAPVPGRA